MMNNTRYLVVVADNDDVASVRWAFSDRDAAARMLAAERDAAPAQTYMIVKDDERRAAG
jgi:hypothetical protein